LCGKNAPLTKTECCGNWLCDDAASYVLFSYARNSCSRNHDHYTLCAFHHREQHPGSWKECPLCSAGFQTEVYVYFGTNEYNFEKLENPPAYEPTRCSTCGVVIRLSEDGHAQFGEQIWCQACADDQLEARLNAIQRSARSPRDAHEAPFTPAAARKWASLEGRKQTLLLNNVWCGTCRATTTIVRYQGKVERGTLVLEGHCIRCDGSVARAIE
jgi:hypothetical protein